MILKAHLMKMLFDDFGLSKPYQLLVYSFA